MFLLMVDMKSLQVLFGGTFDPVHYGHLKLAGNSGESDWSFLVIIMPNNVPPHRAQPEASGEQRQRMVELAIADKPLFSLMNARTETRYRLPTPRKRSKSGARSKDRTCH